jgi:O-antigen/teichoic acid export membrane protein
MCIFVAASSRHHVPVLSLSTEGDSLLADLSLDTVLTSRTLTSLTIMSLRGLALVAKFALTLFITRFIGLETLGVYGLVAGAAVMFPVIASLGLIRVVSRNAVSQQLDEVTRVLRRYWSIQAALYVIIGFVALWVGVYIGQLALISIVISIVFLEHVNGDLFVLLNHLLRPCLANVLMFFRTAGWICIYMILAFIFPALRDLHALLIFWVGGGLLAIAGFALAARDWPWLRPAPEAGHREWFLSHFKASRILYVNDIANTVAQYTDRYLVGLFMGLEFTGVYVLFWSIGNALSNLVDTGIIQISEPKLINAHTRQDRSYWGVFRVLLVETVAISIILAIATGVLVKFAIPYLNRPLVADWTQVLWLVLVGFVLRMAYEVQGAVFYSRYKDIFTLFSGLFVIALSIVANMILIPSFALYGAASAIVLSYIAGIIARHIMITSYFR